VTPTPPIPGGAVAEIGDAAELLGVEYPTVTTLANDNALVMNSHKNATSAR
jgi:hypothetical protein